MARSLVVLWVSYTIALLELEAATGAQNIRVDTAGEKITTSRIDDNVVLQRI